MVLFANDHFPRRVAEQGVRTTVEHFSAQVPKPCISYRDHFPPGPSNKVFITREHFPLQQVNKVFITREHFPLQPEKKSFTTCIRSPSSPSDCRRHVGQCPFYQGMKAEGINFETLGRLTALQVQWNHLTPLQTHIPRFDMMWEVKIQDMFSAVGGKWPSPQQRITCSCFCVKLL
jgi:hypothetical protein